MTRKSVEVLLKKESCRRHGILHGEDKAQELRQDVLQKYIHAQPLEPTGLMDAKMRREAVLSKPPEDRSEWEIRLLLANVEHNRFFTKYSHEQRQDICRILRLRDADQGEVIFNEGDPGDSFYIIMHGTVTVRIGGQEGSKTTTVATLKSGDEFGEWALMEDGGRRQATVIAVANTELLYIVRDDFKRCVQVWTEKEVHHKTMFLSQLPFLSHCPTIYLQHLGRFYERVTYKAGVDIVKTGSETDRLFVIESGRCIVEKRLTMIQERGSKRQYTAAALRRMLDELPHFGWYRVVQDERTRQLRIEMGLAVSEIGEFETFSECEAINDCERLYHVRALCECKLLWVPKSSFFDQMTQDVWMKTKAYSNSKSSWRNARLQMILDVFRNLSWVPEWTNKLFEPEVPLSAAKRVYNGALVLPGSFSVDVANDDWVTTDDPLKPVVDRPASLHDSHSSGGLMNNDSRMSDAGQMLLYFHGLEPQDHVYHAAHRGLLSGVAVLDDHRQRKTALAKTGASAFKSKVKQSTDLQSTKDKSPKLCRPKIISRDARSKGPSLLSTTLGPIDRLAADHALRSRSVEPRSEPSGGGRALAAAFRSHSVEPMSKTSAAPDLSAAGRPMVHSNTLPPIQSRLQHYDQAPNKPTRWRFAYHKHTPSSPRPGVCYSVPAKDVTANEVEADPAAPAAHDFRKSVGLLHGNKPSAIAKKLTATYPNEMSRSESFFSATMPRALLPVSPRANISPIALRTNPHATVIPVWKFRDR